MKAGYGFINVRSGEHTGKDLFVHYTSIKVSNSQYRYLIAGEYVQFDVAVPQDGKHDFHAINVTGIQNGPIMCETRKEQQAPTPRMTRDTTMPAPATAAPAAATAAPRAPRKPRAQKTV